MTPPSLTGDCASQKI